MHSLYTTNLVAVRAAIGIPQLFNKASDLVWLTPAVSLRRARFVFFPGVTPPHVHAKVGEVFPIHNPDRINIHEVKENTCLFDELADLRLVSPYRSVIGALPEADSAVNLCDKRVQGYSRAFAGTIYAYGGRLQSAP